MVLFKSLLLAALASSVAAKSAVLDLVPSNFDKVVLKSGKPTLVEFFAPWCGHCKQLAPVYEELANAFQHSDKVQIAKVDADAERELGKRFGVQGFPTLKWFDGKSDKPEEYNSGRDLDSLTSFITEKTKVAARKKPAMPSNVLYLNDETFPKMTGSDKNVLVAFTAPWCGHCKNLAPIWESVADDFANEEDVVIAKVDAESADSKATAEAQGVKSYPTIKWFHAGNKDGVAYEGGRGGADFLTFINDKVGTHRVPGGGLDDTAGTVAALDDIVIKFLAGSALADVAAEAKTLAGSIKEAAAKKYAEYYLRVFSKLTQNGGWVAKESTRLESILAKGGLAPAKRDEIKVKTNILRRFLQKLGTEGEEEEEEKEETKDEL